MQVLGTEKKSVFLVEDEAVVAYEVRKRLEAAGYTISGVATSSEEALRVLPEVTRSLILMDVNLGDNIDGIEVASRVRQHSEAPIMYLTGSSEQAVIERAKATDPFGYILKPFSSSMLELSVDLAFQRYALQCKVRAAETTESRYPNQSFRSVQQPSQSIERGLLNSLETLMCSPHFMDLELGYDHKTREFYAGCETGKDLRQLLFSIVLNHSTQSRVSA